MKILYIHGYGSSVKPNHPKYEALSGINNAEVHAIAPNYDLGYNHILEELKNKFDEVNPDLIIGCSMGGYSANLLGNIKEVPSISLNPATNPEKISAADLSNLGYKPFIKDNKSPNHVFLNKGDEVIPYKETLRYLMMSNSGIDILDGGCHRFNNIEDIIDVAENMMLFKAFENGDNGGFCND